MDRDLAGRDSILNVILDVHMRNTGALETCKEDQLRDIKILKTRYFNWEPSVGCGGKYEKFDDAVQNLLVCVLIEYYEGLSEPIPQESKEPWNNGWDSVSVAIEEDRKNKDSRI